VFARDAISRVTRDAPSTRDHHALLDDDTTTRSASELSSASPRISRRARPNDKRAKHA